jgi:hypothetical protein
LFAPNTHAAHCWEVFIEIGEMMRDNQRTKLEYYSVTPGGKLAQILELDGDGKSLTYPEALHKVFIDPHES